MLLRKLLFAPLFLLTLTYFFFLIPKLLLSSDLLFSFEIKLLMELITIVAVLLLSGFLFVVFITLASDWRWVLPVGIVGSILPLILTPAPQNYIIAGGVIVTTVYTILALSNKLATYLNFQPTTLLGSSIKHFSMIIILFLSLAFYLSSVNQIKEKGFSIPDSLVDSALQLVPQTQTEQIPQTTQKPTTSQDVVKSLVKKQLDDALKPYLSYIPIILSFLFYITLTTISSLLSIFINPILFLLFYIFEKTKFIHFEVETREVKKLVV